MKCDLNSIDLNKTAHEQSPNGLIAPREHMYTTVPPWAVDSIAVQANLCPDDPDFGWVAFRAGIFGEKMKGVHPLLPTFAKMDLAPYLTSRKPQNAIDANGNITHVYGGLVGFGHSPDNLGAAASVRWREARMALENDPNAAIFNMAPIYDDRGLWFVGSVLPNVKMGRVIDAANSETSLEAFATRKIGDNWADWTVWGTTIVGQGAADQPEDVWEGQLTAAEYSAAAEYTISIRAEQTEVETPPEPVVEPVAADPVVHQLEDGRTLAETVSEDGSNFDLVVSDVSTRVDALQAEVEELKAARDAREVEAASAETRRLLDEARELI